MNIITYKTVLKIISDINSFAEQADNKIQQLWNNFNNSKQNLEKQYNQFVSKTSTEYDNKFNNVKKNATALKESAEKIYQEVLSLDTNLANADKYYVKTKINKEKELSEKTQDSIIKEDDFFGALDKIKNQFQVLSDKYTKDKLPALFDGINYLFSEKRKHDYEELIILKNTLEKIIDEIIKTIQELMGDSLQTDKDNRNKKMSEIESKYQSELSALNAKYENNVETLADDICKQLDIILPDSLLNSLKSINEQYPVTFSGITTNYGTWDGTVIIGYIDYPLELFVTSNILFSLIKDKCKAIVTQNKLLRFPLIFSIDNEINLFVKYTAENDYKNQFIDSIIQCFIASVPVSHLSFTVIDTESQGKNISSFSNFIQRLPSLFDNGIITANNEIEGCLKKISNTIDSYPLLRLVNNNEESNKVAKINDIKVLIVYDPPEALGDKNVISINNIIKNGGRCGIYTVIGYKQPSNGQSVYHEKGSVIFQQAVDMFLYYNLHVVYNNVLEGRDLTKYINDYLFLTNCKNGNIMMIDSDVTELISGEYTDNTKNIFDSIKCTLDKFNTTFGNVPLNDQSFPVSFPVGFVTYSMDLISDIKTLSLIKADLDIQFEENINLPAIFDLYKKNNLLISCPDQNHKHIVTFIHGLMWSFLSFIPVSKVNFCIFDAERRGNSITPFLDFRQKLPEIFDNQIYTTQDTIFSRLQKLNIYIDEFIQDKLGNRFENIVEYNLNTPNRTESIILLIIFDFPRNFDNRSIELLLNILSNGSKCGIYTIICNNSDISFSKYESIDEHLELIKKHCSLLEYLESNYVLQPYGLPIKAASGLSKEKVTEFITEYINANTKAKHKSLSFSDVVCPPYFTATTAKRLSIPVGIGDGETIVKLVLGEGSSHHGIIAGATGSGKSTLLHTIIMSSMLCHSPDELHLYLMDFKSGTEFKIYESIKPPHIQLLALDAMQEFGESILENLVNEMLRRSDLFKSSGQSSLADYINNTGKKLPRILVIMDEFQVLFNDSSNRKIAMNCAELTKRIVTEGRSFGIHLLMSTQTTKVISELTLSHGIIEQMRIRIGLKCGEDDVRYLFNDRNDIKALEMMKGPIGTAVMNLEYMESNNIGFRTAYCTKEMQAEYLSHISSNYSDYPITMQIFEGNRTISLLDYLKHNNIGFYDEPIIKIYMGTLIKVSPPFVLQLDRRRRHNLLICGANERMSENITNLCMFTALLNTNTNIFCIDGEGLIGENSSSEMYECLSEFTQSFKFSKNRSDIVLFVNELYSTYTERKKRNEIKQTLFVIKNLQFLDIIKKMFKGDSIDENEYSTDSSAVTSSFDFGTSGSYNSSSLSISEKLLQLIDDGSNYGIFFIVSSLEYQSVKENMYYGENVLSKFPERIVFSLNNSDSDNLIDGVSVSNLRDNTVYYTDGVKTAFQYKPYIMPDVSDLVNFIKCISTGGKNK